MKYTNGPEVDVLNCGLIMFVLPGRKPIAKRNTASPMEEGPETWGQRPSLSHTHISVCGY